MIWVIGSKGMLASDIIALLNKSDIPYFASDIEVDITSFNILKEFVSNKNIDVIINCSAYTAVDKAEEEEEKAFLINEKGVSNIATVAKEIDATLFHISTDYVFPGTEENPLSEDTTTGPISVYGASKLAGEDAIRSICTKYFIIRTAWLYGQNGPNFVTTMLKLMNSRDELGIIADQWGSPTWTKDLAQVIKTIIECSSEKYGEYHFSNEGKTNWFLFASEIYKNGSALKLIDSPCVLKAISTEEYPTKAKRPQFSLLSKNKIKNTFSLTIPQWQKSLASFMKEL